MAKHFVDTRCRTKWNVLQGLQCLWWILCVVSLVCINRCFAGGEERAIAIYPKGDSTVRFGDDLELFCVALKNYTAKDLKFSLSNISLPTEIYNETTIRLFVEKPKVSRQTYYCDTHKGPARQVAVKTVYVSPAPREVTDFKCMSKNLEVLNCTWTTPDSILLTTYSLSYSVNGSPVKPCVAHYEHNSLMRYCYWNASSNPVYRQLEDTYHFTLESSNEIGSLKQNFTIDHFSIVKPDPPTELKNISQTAHSVLLQWTIGRNMYILLPSDGLVHKIEYQIAKIDNTSYFRQVNTSQLPPKDKIYTFNLTDLPYAHTKYGVRVYIRPTKAKSDEFWSDFSNIVVYTASERPQRPPDTIAGAFDQSPFTGRRLLYIYWKQIEEYEEAGANFTYKILITQGSRTKMYEPDASKSLGYLILDHNNDIETLKAMDVRIHSCNEMGFSVNSSYLHIPSEEDTRSLQLSLFTKLAYENGTYELSWARTHNDDIDNYTLIWCQHNTTNICSGRINFTTIEPTRSKHIIHLSRNYRYQFAISANRGLRTSGMIWAKCDISKDGIAMFDFPIRFMDHDPPGTTFVKLKWSMDCTLKDGIINGYNITYCPVRVLGTSTECDKSLGDLSKSYIIDDRKQMEATIHKLRPYTTYQFTMGLMTIYGLKIIKNTTVSITTLEDTPTKPQNVRINDVQHDSMRISWDLPLHLNGHNKSIRYIIHYNEKNRTYKYEENRPFKIRLDELTAFTNYTITLMACNEGINSCSGETKPITVRTRIGAPAKMVAPLYNNNKLFLINPPKNAGGTLDGYQIRIIKDAKEEILLNTSSLSHEVPSCDSGVQNVTYQVRAYNLDTEKNHGTWTDSEYVTLPERNDTETTFYGEWSDTSTVLCKGKDNLFWLLLILGFLLMVGFGCGVLKLYKKVRKMGDIKPEFPKDLFIPGKDISKFPFPGIYPSDKDEKPTSDEMLLLPSSKSSVPSPESKTTENDNCGASEHTDSTALSDASQGPVERQNSTSDESTESSIQLEETPKNGDASQEERDFSNTDTASSSESSPYFSDNKFKKNKATGYIQPVINPASGYVQSVPTSFKNPTVDHPSQPTTSSYVMAGLPPPIFTNGVPPSSRTNQSLPATGYVRAEDIEVRNAMNFPKLGPSPTKVFGSESLPTMPNLPTPKKLGEDSSYIQLQSLDGLPSHKPTVINTVPFKPAASSGYVRPEDAVINKHLNLLAGGQPAEESAILDPTMSPDAYCRFSWSTDPSNDNLHSLLANPPALKPSKN